MVTMKDLMRDEEGGAQASPAGSTTLDDRDDLAAGNRVSSRGARDLEEGRTTLEPGRRPRIENRQSRHASLTT